MQEFIDDGRVSSGTLESTVSLIEVLTCVFEYSYMASQLALVFSANRTGISISLVI